MIQTNFFQKMTEREILDEIQRLEIAEMFIELPSRIEYPDYYQVIQHPIALQDMRNKLGPLYSLADLKSDFDQMVQNAFTYNIKGSAVYTNAKALDLKFNEMYDIASFRQQLLETIDALNALISIQSFIKLEALKKGIKLIKSQADLEIELQKLEIDSKDKQIIKKHFETISSDIYVDQGSHSNIGEPLDELIVARISYKIGDFCYVSSKIVQIFEIWKNDDGYSFLILVQRALEVAGFHTSKTLFTNPIPNIMSGKFSNQILSPTICGLKLQESVMYFSCRIM